MASLIQAARCSSCEAKLSHGSKYCSRCKTWNFHKPASQTFAGMQRLSEVVSTHVEHISTGPWDRCFGVHYESKKMGIVRTSVNLVGGVPGAGKSTLSLQLTDALAQHLQRDIIYIAAEESLPEVRVRAIRLGLKNLHLIQGISALGGMQTELGALLLAAKPGGIILDSLPGLSLDTPEQAVEYCKALKGYAVALNCPIIVIDHATKADDLAGLLALQHAVDSTNVLYVQPDESRILSPMKNRNGPSDVEVHMRMTEQGLIAGCGNERCANCNEELESDFDVD